MAITLVYRNSVSDSGSPGITIPAGAALAVWSAGGCKVSQWLNFPQYPQKLGPVQTVAPQVQYVTSTYSAGATLVIEAYGAEVYYEVGTAPIVQFVSGGGGGQTGPNAVNTSATLTVAQILGQVITSTTAAAVTATLPTGTVLDAGSTFNIGDVFDFSVINTGGTNAITVTTATGWTLVGAMAVAANTSGRFRLYKTAANTFTMFRMS